MSKSILIGLGNIGAKFNNINNVSRTHLDALIKCKINPTHLIDKTSRNFNSLSRKFQIKKECFFKLNKLKNKISTDILTIATPPNKRYNLLKFVSKKIDYKFLIIEKPLSQNFKDAKLIINLLKKNKIKVFVNYQRNWDLKTSEFLKKIKKEKISFIKIIYNKGFLNSASHYLYEIIKICGRVDFKSLKLLNTNGKKYENFSFYLKVGKTPVYFISNNYNKKKIEYLELSFHCENSVYELASGGVHKKITTMRKNEIYDGFNFLSTKSKSFHIGPLNSLLNLYKDVLKINLHRKKYDNTNLMISFEILKLQNKLKKLCHN